MLALLIVVVAALTQADNGRFLSSYSVQGTLLLASALAFVSFGQLIVLLTGNIDLSVGPLMALTVVVTSFFWTTARAPATSCSGSLR